MAFQQEVNITKVSIQDFEILFFSPGPDNVGGAQAGRISVQIEQSDGSILTRNYDLLTRLQDDAEGQGYLANLADLRDYIRTRLNNEVLP